jgi:hypothetical protein
MKFYKHKWRTHFFCTFTEEEHKTRTLVDGSKENVIYAVILHARVNWENRSNPVTESTVMLHSGIVEDSVRPLTLDKESKRFFVAALMVAEVSD